MSTMNKISCPLCMKGKVDKKFVQRLIENLWIEYDIDFIKEIKKAEELANGRGAASKPSCKRRLAGRGVERLQLIHELGVGLLPGFSSATARPAKKVVLN